MKWHRHRWSKWEDVDTRGLYFINPIQLKRCEVCNMVRRRVAF